MVQPYWLVDREHRREGVVVNGNDAWALFCACADGNHAEVRRLVEANPDLIYAQIWYQQPIDLAIREGHLSIVQTIFDADTDRRLGNRVYHESHYRMNFQEIKRRGYVELARWMQERKRVLVPNYRIEFDELKERIANGNGDVIDDIRADPTLLAATIRAPSVGSAPCCSR